MRQTLRDCYRLLKRRLYVSGRTERTIIDDFHRLYHQRGKLDGSAWCATRWRGRPVAQNPMDLLAIARILQDNPMPVLEIGTGHGGSALFYRDAGAPNVVTIDITPPRWRLGDLRGMVRFIQGDSLTVSTNEIGLTHALVILDGDHHAHIVGRELIRYAPYVPRGGYLIVCDTHFNGHPIDPAFGPGPWEAVETFLAERDDFVRDRKVEPLLTFNPGGYLRRIK